MGSSTPARETIRIFKGTTFSYLFEINENGAALDLTALEKIEATLKDKYGNQVFKHVTGTDLVIAGAENSQLVGSASADLMDLDKKVDYYLEFRFFYAGGVEDVYILFNVEIIDESSRLSETAHEWTINIDPDSAEASAEQLTGLYAATLLAKDQSETAAGTAITKAGEAADSQAAAAGSASSAGDGALDAQKHAQNTEPFTDSQAVDFDKGAKGYAADSAASAGAAAVSEQNSEDAHQDTLDSLDQRTIDNAGYYLNQLAGRHKVGEPLLLLESVEADIVAPPDGYRVLFFNTDNENRLSVMDSSGTTTAI